jgi:hypothetical protein
MLKRGVLLKNNGSISFLYLTTTKLIALEAIFVRTLAIVCLDGSVFRVHSDRRQVKEIFRQKNIAGQAQRQNERLISPEKASVPEDKRQFRGDF